MRLLAKHLCKLLIDKHKKEKDDESRVIYDVTWNTDTVTNQYVLMTRLVLSGSKGKGIS